MAQLIKPISSGAGSQLILSPPTTNLALWIEADSGVTEVSGKVSAVTDKSPSPKTINQTTAGVRPTKVTTPGLFNGKPYFHGGAGWLQTNYTFPTNGTVIAVGRNYRPVVSSSDTNGQVDTIVTSDNGGFQGLRVESYNWYNSGFEAQAAISCSAGTGSSNSYRDGWKIDGLGTSIQTEQLENCIYSGDWTGITVSNNQNAKILATADGSLLSNMDICGLLVYSSVLTETQRWQAEAYLAYKYGIQHISLANLVIGCVGDSLTEGYLLKRGQSYPYQLAALYGNNPSMAFYNEAVDGTSLSDMIGRTQAANGILNRPFGGNGALTSPRKIAVVWGGTNDMYFDDVLASPTDTFSRLVELCGDMKAGGWELVVGTCIPRGNNTSAWSSYNTLIRNNLATLQANGMKQLADYTLNSAFATGTATSNATYYQGGAGGDLTHTTAAGNAIIAAINKVAIDNILAA